MMLRAGSLNRLIAYQLPTQPTGFFEQTVTEWTTRASMWARIASPTGRESLNAAQMQATASHTITVRYAGFALTPLGRFLYGDRIFNISAVLNVDERNRQVDCLCIEQFPGPPTS